MPEGPVPAGEDEHGPALDVDVAGRSVRVTHPGKVLDPTTGATKADLVGYFTAISAQLVPHTAGRCVTLRRYPDGIEGESFFTKRCPPARPEWIPDAVGPGEPAGSTRYCVLDSAAALAWAANLAAVELHTPMASAVDLDRPRACVFDLDPGPGTDLADCARLALEVDAVLRGFDLRSWPKTSGAKGLQLYVPLAGGADERDAATHEHCAEFALAVGQLLEARHPERVTTVRTRTERRGRILVDWQQNARFATTVCVYSPRARPGLTVSTPVTWDEVADLADSRVVASLVFTPTEVLDRVGRLGDLFAPVLRVDQQLPRPRN